MAQMNEEPGLLLITLDDLANRCRQFLKRFEDPILPQTASSLIDLFITSRGFELPKHTKSEPV